MVQPKTCCVEHKVNIIIYHTNSYPKYVANREKDSFGSIRQKKESINKEISDLEIKEGEQITEEEIIVLRNKRNELNDIIHREE